MDALQREEINVYLAYEWGLYDEDNPPTKDRPFELEYCGKTEHQIVYRFVDDTGEPHFAGITGEGEERTFWASATGDMSFEDFTDMLRGANWLYGQEHIDLYPERITDGKPPRRLRKQRSVIDGFASEAFGPRVAYEVLLGYYLKGLDQYVALVQAKRSQKTFLVGSGIEPAEVGFPNASAGDRISLALARHVLNN